MRLEIDCYHNERNKIGNTDILFTRNSNDSLKNNHPLVGLLLDQHKQAKPELAASPMLP
jgi:hypothetical protein